MIYFVSDTHLGLSSSEYDSRNNELRFVRWLQNLTDCDELFLLGDIFDYWFEYKKVIPKGFTRLFGQLSIMADKGVKIHFYAGNHDLWLDDYFQKEIGIDVHLCESVVDICGRKVLLSHGDAVAGNISLLGRIFRSSILKRIFHYLIHPDLAMKFGQWWSLHNRNSRMISHEFQGENEGLVKSAREALLKYGNLDYIICGHIHIPLEYNLNDKTKLIVLGQWLSDDTPTFATMDTDGIVSLKSVD